MSKHYRAFRSFLPTAAAVGKRLSRRQPSQEIVLGGNISITIDNTVPEAAPSLARLNTHSFAAASPKSSAFSAASAATSPALPPANSSSRNFSSSSSPLPPAASHSSSSLSPSPIFPSSSSLPFASLPSAFPSPPASATVIAASGTVDRRFAEPLMATVLPVFGGAAAFPGRPSPLSRGFPSSWSDSGAVIPAAIPASIPAAVSAADAAAAPSPPVRRGVQLQSNSAARVGSFNVELVQRDWTQQAAWMRLDDTAGNSRKGDDNAADAERDHNGERDNDCGDAECTADDTREASTGTFEVVELELGTADSSAAVRIRNEANAARSWKGRQLQQQVPQHFLPKPPPAPGTNPESVLSEDENSCRVDSTQTYHSVGWIGNSKRERHDDMAAAASMQHHHHDRRHEPLSAAHAPDDTCRPSHVRHHSYQQDDSDSAGWLVDRGCTAAESWVSDSRLDEGWVDSARSRIRDAALQLVEAQQAALEHSRVASAMEAAMLKRQTSLGRSPGGNGKGGKVRKSMMPRPPPGNDVDCHVRWSSLSSPVRRPLAGDKRRGVGCDNVRGTSNGGRDDMDLVAGRLRAEGLRAWAGGNSPLGRVGMMLRLGSSK
ncbi:hypothetical protein CLOP_g2453 [Closterium sp. NIES-67]|nr:hypothetical protein CLOP_g2453 [Closterium sp. NIES-67]